MNGKFVNKGKVSCLNCSACGSSSNAAPSKPLDNESFTDKVSYSGPFYSGLLLK